MSADGTAKVWNAEKGPGFFSQRAYCHRRERWSWSPDGQRIFAWTLGNVVLVWSAVDGQPVDSVDPPRPVNGPALSPDGFLRAEPRGMDVALIDTRRVDPNANRWPLPDRAERIRYHTEQAALRRAGTAPGLPPPSISAGCSSTIPTTPISRNAAMRLSSITDSLSVLAGLKQRVEMPDDLPRERDEHRRRSAPSRSTTTDSPRNPHRNSRPGAHGSSTRPGDPATAETPSPLGKCRCDRPGASRPAPGKPPTHIGAAAVGGSTPAAV